MKRILNSAERSQCFGTGELLKAKNQIFRHEPIKDILLQIFGDEYKKTINYIMKNQTNKQDFCFHDKPIYKFDDFLFGIYINGHCGAIMHFNGFFRVKIGMMFLRTHDNF